MDRIKLIGKRPLEGRCKLAYDWIPDNTDRLLDAGCSDGDFTVYYAQKAKETFGVDIDDNSIIEAQTNYPDISFSQSELEELPFEDGFFDTVICTDVLEHTNDRIKSLSEMFRVLSRGGVLILSVPHSGRYEFLDPYNYGYYLRKYLRPLYWLIYNSVRVLKRDSRPPGYNPLHEQKHFHYSYDDLLQMIEKTPQKQNYQIEEVFRSGLLWEPISLNAVQLLPAIRVKPEKFRFVRNTLKNSSDDYWVEYGEKAYNIALKIRKL